jgi:hypothetical protein
MQIVDVPANERTNQVDVVNHEIQHHRDIGPAGVERRESVTLDKARSIDERKCAANCAVEPLDVSRLNQRSHTLSDSEQIVRLVDRRRDRLLDHHVNTTLECRLGDRVVADCGYDDRHGLDLIEQLIQRRDCRNAQFRADLTRAIRTYFVKADQSRAFHVTQQPNVMLAEASGADDADAHAPAQITTPR